MAPNADPPLNSSGLSLDSLRSPSSTMSVRIVEPELAERVADPRTYRVRLALDALDADALGVDVALDAERPRRLAPARAEIGLAELSAAGSELSFGEHWLFAAAIGASGLVPQSGPGAPRAAVARRFFIGKPDDPGRGPSGVVWLRKPEGTYNGPAAEHVLFDAFAFDGAGVPLETPITISLDGPVVRGQLRLPLPFSAREIENGDFAATASAATARPASVHFTVNHELGGGP